MTALRSFANGPKACLAAFNRPLRLSLRDGDTGCTDEATGRGDAPRAASA